MKTLLANFEAKIKDGELVFYRKKELKDFLLTLQGDVWITVEKLNTKRTLTQNAYYWFYLRVIASETGHNPDELHEYFRRVLLPPRFIKIFDNEIKIPSSTTDLDKSDFSEYLDKISALTNVPLPNI